MTNFSRKAEQATSHDEAMKYDVAAEAQRKGYNVDTSNSMVWIYCENRPVSHTEVQAAVPSVGPFETRLMNGTVLVEIH